jgi:prepilin-type N-terminal cleavage/methylation domain-containing protein
VTGGYFIIGHSGDSRAGLTLIEVLLATVILAVGMTALVTATSRCLAVAGKAKEYETARRLLGQVDLEIPIEFDELEEGVESGNFSGEFRDYTWRREIIEFDDEELEMFTVVTSVQWSRKGSEAKEEVATYIYGPTYVRGEANEPRTR